MKLEGWKADSEHRKAGCVLVLSELHAADNEARIAALFLDILVVKANRFPFPPSNSFKCIFYDLSVK